jgi:hypothetical protein
MSQPDNAQVIEECDFDNDDVIGPEEDTGVDANVEDWS